MENTAYRPLLRKAAPATQISVPRENVVRYLRFIAANMRRYRLRRGLTQEALAEIADLDLRFLQRIERGTTNLSISVLIAIAEALQIAPTALFRVAKLGPSRPGRPRKSLAPSDTR